VQTDKKRYSSASTASGNQAVAAVGGGERRGVWWTDLADSVSRLSRPAACFDALNVSDHWPIGHMATL